MIGSGKLVLVTGASRGLGLGISLALLEEGYGLIGVARHHTDDFSALVRRHPSRAFFESADLSDVLSIRAFCQSLQKKYGRIFGLVNNAAQGIDGLLPTMHETEIDAMLRVNLHSPILLSKYLCRGMLLNQMGRIINISSIASSTGFSGLAVYGATKAGLVGFTRSLARELGRAGVTVNCIAPGYMETDMTASLEGDRLNSILRRSPMLRFPTTTEVASAVSYLMSDRASAVTGTVLTVDAGSTA